MGCLAACLGHHVCLCAISIAAHPLVQPVGVAAQRLQLAQDDLVVEAFDGGGPARGCSCAAADRLSEGNLRVPLVSSILDASERMVLWLRLSLPR